MAVRLRAWLPLSAGLMLAVAGCRTASTPRPVSCRYALPPVTRSVNPPPSFAAAPLHAPQAAAIAGGEELAENGQAVEQPPRDKPPVRPAAGRLQLPSELPGSNAPVIELPEMKPGNEAKRKEAIGQSFPPLGPLAAPATPAPGPDGKPLTLGGLQQIALEHNPALRQASAAIDAARGAAVQAGLYPNPRVGVQSDDINQSNTAGKHGGFVEQTIKTGGKLQLARAAADIAIENAELARRKIEIDILTQVRKGYFNVLVANRATSVARAFAGLSSEVYSIQVDRLRVGQTGIHEPLQARVQAVQARAVLLKGENRLLSAWRQLAAALGQPDLPYSALEGDLDRAVPRFLRDEVLARVLDSHTDVFTAGNNVSKAQFQLRLAQVTPRPDLGLSYSVFYDKTSQPNNATHGVSIGIELPLWNRNQGAIQEAQAHLAMANDEQVRVRNSLTAQIAGVFEKYDNSRSLVLMYRDQMVPDQVRAYRGVYRGYETGVETLNFNDVITAQQTLAETIRSYVDSIGELWASVTELANLLQLEDLESWPGLGEGKLDRCPVPALDQLPLPRKPEKQKPAALEAPLSSSGVEDLPSTKGPDTDTPQVVPVRIKKVSWTRAAVPFEVRELREGKRRIAFNVVPLHGE